MDENASVRAVVAVDGPSGSGKSSVSRGVARALGLHYLDTGAMYRAMTWALLRDGVDLTDAAAVALACEHPVIVSGTDPDRPTISVDGEDVSVAIREALVTSAVSTVSAIPQVRQRLLRLQRAAVEEASAAGCGIVVEGRDIGTVVLPDADLKVFLVADAAVRAARRAAENAARAGAPSVHAHEIDATEEELRRRDAHDTGRATSPLTQAPDAVVVDATDLGLEEVIARVTALVVASGEPSA